jgi:hypothetical protein
MAATREDTAVAQGSKRGAGEVTLPASPELDALLEAALSHEMTPEELREQRVSFAYGNLAIDDPAVTKEDVREADRRMRHSDDK